ncbi:hypothetical protein SDC9_104184 [bioreactor metagenome]|uniref:Uncharacterized protein n=1 Tax=bioreactor metagenome TaxID=1076179 RepID=A0A645AVT9_9ZZZZ
MSPSLFIGQINLYNAVKSSGAQERRIQHIRPISRSDHKDFYLIVRRNSVHLDQKLVECLIVFLVAVVLSSFSAQHLDFINEDYGTVPVHPFCSLFGLGE